MTIERVPPSVIAPCRPRISVPGGILDVLGEDLQRNRNARLALSVQVSRALRELGYCSLGATELPDTVSDKIN